MPSSVKKPTLHRHMCRHLLYTWTFDEEIPKGRAVSLLRLRVLKFTDHLSTTSLEEWRPFFTHGLQCDLQCERQGPYCPVNWILPSFKYSRLMRFFPMPLPATLIAPCNVLCILIRALNFTPKSQDTLVKGPSLETGINK